jgi:hypothetical protein
MPVDAVSSWQSRPRLYSPIRAGPQYVWSLVGSHAQAFVVNRRPSVSKVAAGAPEDPGWGSERV